MPSDESLLAQPATEILLKAFLHTRHQTERLCKPLMPEDFVPQPIVDVSPPRWHLAHTTWFFEKFILEPYEPGYQPFHPQYHYLFNSYYIQAGERWARAQRGHLTRPTVQEIMAFRASINDRISALLPELDEQAWQTVKPLLEIGINHEQQHQELLIYDLKYILCHNPTEPVYNTLNPSGIENTEQELPDDFGDFESFGGSIHTIGHTGDGFAFDNEGPAHKVLVPAFHLRKGLVTNGEYLEFMQDKGYETPTLWLDDGWSWLQEEDLKAPMYWHKLDNGWHEMTLNGMRPLNPTAPVTHISFYEAEAFATWAGYRLPTEFEWEVAAQSFHEKGMGNFQDLEIFHPVPPQQRDSKFYQLFGDVWEWTYSAYLPYPGFRPAPGALGEYNGKFMINQMVLRGGSCATPKNHIRNTYRNFFHPDKRWLFSGIRLAADPT